MKSLSVLTAVVMSEMCYIIRLAQKYSSFGSSLYRAFVNAGCFSFKITQLRRRDFNKHLYLFSQHRFGDDSVPCPVTPCSFAVTYECMLRKRAMCIGA